MRVVQATFAILFMRHFNHHLITIKEKICLLPKPEPRYEVPSKWIGEYSPFFFFFAKLFFYASTNFPEYFPPSDVSTNLNGAYLLVSTPLLARVKKCVALLTCFGEWFLLSALLWASRASQY